MKIYLTTLGCKLNQSEAEDWARRLAIAGCEVVGDPTDADVCIVNTCTVTHVAARKSRQIVRRCANASPRAQVVVTGCYAEISPAEAAQLPGLSLVLNSAAKERLVGTIAERFGHTLKNGPAVPHAPSLHTRALVKIQDGCDNACTYCIVRIARGRQRSRSAGAILDEVLAREAQAYQEIVLTGVHIGAYGHERGETLAKLVSTILSRTQLPRIRLSSIEPWDLTPELLRMWEDPRLCRHLHLPLQSGCDATLRRMNRRYTTAHYRELLDSGRRAIPDLAVTTDVIVGFPGEDEPEFATCAGFVASMDFARVHVFPFSSRPGTVAASLPAQIPPEVKEGRGTRMRAIAARSTEAFRRQFLGRCMDVLWESSEAQQWSGLTDNYIRVQVSSSEPLHNRILPARLLELSGDAVRGELISDG